MNNKLSTITNLFDGKKIRSIWDAEKEDYYFSVVDVIETLTDSNIPKRYWTDLKRKLIDEGSELYEKIVRLKMRAQDGKMRETDTLDTKGIRKENLRDNMTDLEVAITNIGELATREIAKNEKPKGLSDNRKVAKLGGGVAKRTKDFFEEETGSQVVSNSNSQNYQYLDDNRLIEK